MKKIKNFGKVLLLSFLSIAVVSILLLNGCKKLNSGERPALLENNISQTAKNYIASLADKEKDISAQPPGEKPAKGIKKRVTPFSKMAPLVKWDQSTVGQYDDLRFIILPVGENIKPFENKEYEFFRNIIFCRDKTGKEHMSIIEILGKKGESLGDNYQDIAITAFENKHLSRSKSIGTLNASVFFFNEDYIQEASFQLQNGRWAPVRMSFRSDLDITQ
jgi:hypothetical protein